MYWNIITERRTAVSAPWESLKDTYAIWDCSFSLHKHKRCSVIKQQRRMEKKKGGYGNEQRSTFSFQHIQYHQKKKRIPWGLAQKHLKKHY